MEIRQGPIDRGVIIDLANQIKAGLPGVDVYLFGSYAYGKPNVNSDVDLFIVYPDEAYGKSKVDLLARKLTTRSGVPRDIVATKRSLFEKAKNSPTTLSYCISHEGIQL